MVGRWLFHPEDGGEDWSIVDDHLAKMMELTGQLAFPKDVLDRAKRRDGYFDAHGFDLSAVEQKRLAHSR